MNHIGIVVTFKGPLKRPALLVDICIARIQILISGSDGHVLVPVVLNSGADANLSIVEAVRSSGVLIGDGAGIGAADGPQPAIGKPVL